MKLLILAISLILQELINIKSNNIYQIHIINHSYLQIKQMPIYHEQWRQQEYVTRRSQYLRDLPQNHLAKIKNVKFQFTDYKIYNKLSCLPYQRMMVQCMNNYGFRGSLQNVECHEIMQAFHSCLNVNQYFATLKKTQPQEFLTSDYSRDKPSFSQIKI